MTGFKVRYCLSTGSCDELADTNWTTRTVSGATRRTYTISGLTNGSNYKFQVRTTSSNKGDSAWSTVADEEAGGPDRISRLGLTTPASRQINVTWAAPRSYGDDITGYGVQYRACTATNGSTTVLTCASNPTWGDWESSTHSGVSSTTNTITALTAGTKYQIRVRATNGRGNGQWSPLATATPTS